MSIHYTGDITHMRKVSRVGNGLPRQAGRIGDCRFHLEDKVFLRDKLILPTHSPSLVGPLQQRLVVGADVLGSPARPGLGLALECCVG